MVSFKELKSRVQTDFEFNRSEISSFLLAVLVTGIIFSFQDWGADQFDLIFGLRNLAMVLLLVLITFFFRASCQKIYGLSEGHKAEFKVWWLGIAIALVVCFVTLGRLPLILIGAMSAAFMVRQRLGEFRYGFSYWVQGMIAYWGPMANLILAILFAVGLYFAPDSYFFSQGVMLNLIMATLSFVPLPQLEGLQIFFGSRVLYVLGLALVALAWILLLSQTAFGLITSIVLGTVYGIIYILIGSEK
ncbi:TPA: hypothetical protein HA234_06870 [Candidatus Woesearchaeota archaeon]|nr:hypothetical protein [Candidatus Woesearchaeota archaeon]